MTIMLQTIYITKLKNKIYFPNIEHCIVQVLVILSSGNSGPKNGRVIGSSKAWNVHTVF